MRNDVSPHQFTPLRWFDRFLKHGRCSACLIPRAYHPVRCWMTARSYGDYRFYDLMTVLAESAARDGRGQ